MPTKLDILNHVLRQMMEEPVSSTDSNHPSAQIVMASMLTLNRSVQTRGWWFNTEYSVTLAPDLDGKILLPEDLLDMTVPTSKSYVQRGRYAYDTQSRSFVFGDAIVLDDIKLLLDLDDTPEPFSQYIQYELAYRHHVADDGDEHKANRLMNQALVAWAQLTTIDIKHKKITAIQRPIVSALLSGMRQQGSNYNPNRIGG